ncbi:hypothetical protein FRACA_2040004 [Frankia canadensis]|uniref:Uncharacterized protein n=1 Tax=Frankia canadensis TaxID=1836972 RepID=A0A2I2KQB5_9ACTN|nr:hypothetical protein FRACA_2040004 [Frankia canadensis]SOU55147.1 hypothetical protein FRACA_2040004 [Frankia canadensis]
MDRCRLGLTRNITGIGGDLGATQTDTGTVTL